MSGASDLVYQSSDAGDSLSLLQSRRSHPNPPIHCQHLLISITECTGITHISEDSSEIAFLLVENYQLTAPVGLRVGWEFLKHNTQHEYHIPFHHTSGHEQELGEESRSADKMTRTRKSVKRCDAPPCVCWHSGHTRSTFACCRSPLPRPRITW